MPINKELESKILGTLSRIEERLNATHNLAVKTNGRVTALEKKIIGDEAVDAYRKSKRAANIAIIGAAAAVIGGLWWITSFFHK